MASSVWTGYLTFGLISMPVRLFSGARSSRVSFHMLHRDDHARVKQQLICSEDGKVLERSETVKGYEYSKDEYVIVESEEIKQIEPKTGKAMEILEFVKSEQIDPLYFESSYFLMPDEAGRRPYALLSAALAKSGFVGIAKLTMHNREYTCFLRPYEGGLMLHTMYYQDEVRRLEEFDPPQVELKEGELKVAHQLIEALEGEFDPKNYRDTFEENLKELIKARVEGKDVTPVEKPKKLAPVVDLMAALKQSLEQVEKKPAQRVTSGERVAAAQRASRIHAVEKKVAGRGR